MDLDDAVVVGYTMFVLRVGMDCDRRMSCMFDTNCGVVHIHEVVCGIHTH